MRPRGYYVVFTDGLATHVCHGHEEARRHTKHRAYKRFRTQLEAEEFAAWWNYKNTHQPVPTITTTRMIQNSQRSNTMARTP